MMSAICLSSEDIPRMDGSKRSSTYGPSTMPVMSIPISPGNFSFLQTAAADMPTRKISDNDNYIKNPP